MEKSVVLVSTLLVMSSWALGEDIRKLSMEDMRAMLAEMPQTRWRPFLRGKIDVGYKVEIEREEWENKEEAILSREIFHYFVDNQEEIRKRKELLNAEALTDTVCYPEPIGCFDTDDPGIRPF
ncbi:uncharacterized protein [Euwallacea fornicatus]|uniref:uncharacterized protein n=1 Tax=Euwallacea fornicatus TaxID=995702 RepID=UPI00338E8106